MRKMELSHEVVRNLTHEDTGTTFGRRTFSPQSLDFTISIYLVEFEDGHLDRLSLVLDLLGGGVRL